MHQPSLLLAFPHTRLSYIRPLVLSVCLVCQFSCIVFIRLFTFRLLGLQDPFPIPYSFAFCSFFLDIMFTFTRSAKTLLSLTRDSRKLRRFDQFSTMTNRPGNAFWKEKMVKIRKTLSEEFKKSSPIPTLALIAFDFAVVYGVFHVITQYGVNYTICVGPSMIPTLNEKGDFVLIDVFSYRMLNKDYRVGDVVICVCPYDPDKTVCKRIAAVSGDIVFVSRTRSINNSYVNPFSNVPSIHGDLEKVQDPPPLIYQSTTTSLG